ncbi:MAG: hypothetical protein GXO86_12955 [Chlorobi bacterium]|nr:hypothetical protein [Chlorobiota bacterium]
MKVLFILMILALAFQVFPVALGMNYRELKVKIFSFSFILILGQLLMFQAGYLLGEKFLYLVESFKGTVIFIGFALIGFRLIMESFRVRKGERTYVLEHPGTVALASFAQAIDTFLAGMLFTLFSIANRLLLIVLFLSVTAVIFIGVLMKPDKTAGALSSLLFLLGGIVMLFTALFFGFFV